MPRLSQRGQALADDPVIPEYLREHFAGSSAPHEATIRPDGYIPLCIAENKLEAGRLARALATYEVGPEAFGYDSMIGSQAFREALADFMASRFLVRRFDAGQIAVLAGAGSVLELMFHALCDAGEGVLVPTPSYAGFWLDLETRDALEIVPVHAASDDGFRMTIEKLEHSLATARCKVRALLFTSPNNPMGWVYSREEIEGIVNWARSKGLHLVMDEIYALSVFGEAKFTSVASLAPRLGEDVHIVWAFSKDFGASGLRCGVLVSENQALIRAVDGLSYWAAVSGHTQSLLAQFIADEAAVNEFLEASRRSLAGAYRQVERGLEDLGIPFYAAQAAFFVLCDLRTWLSQPTWEAEHALWRRIVDEVGVNLTPGSACRVAEPGFFRLCFAGVDGETLDEAFRRLARVLD
jgi:aspartate/methionine/tyrosine aminotransferase